MSSSEYNLNYKTSVLNILYNTFYSRSKFKLFKTPRTVVLIPVSCTNNKRDEIIIRLPYIGEITKRLVKQLKKTVQDTGINTTVRGVLNNLNLDLL